MDPDEDALLAAAEEEGESGPQPSPSPPPPEPELTRPQIKAQLRQSTLSFGSLQPADYLPDLNEAQRRAVTYPVDSASLQILAGPGSGKTKVLTTRVAYLIQHYRLDPEELVVVTFTNKAANEMKVRLAAIVGPAVVDKVMMGTFHSVCVRFLRKYGKLIGLASNFLIADRDACLAMIKRAIVSAGMSEEHRKDLKPNTLMDVISKCKSTEMSPAHYRAQAAQQDNSGSAERMEAICKVYEDYEAELATDNALDFDDLLLRGLELFQRFPRVVAKIKSVLIDEFQDTNGTQYSLVKLIARASHSLTIVGDPDQSIYGWRNADVENLEKMIKDFSPVEQIYLEENYRSTGAILGAALAVVQQDKKRINKGLKATHTAGSSVVLHCAPNAFDEASFIAAQIKHLIAHTGGLLDFGDIAILLRYGALSRVIEVALQKAGIPSRMVGGHKFFDRQEVRDVLAYLQLADNPSYTAAFTRVVNTPKRGIGDKTVRDILAAAKQKGVSAFEVCVKSANGSGMAGVTSAQRKGLRTFVSTVRDLKQMAEDGKSVSEMIDTLCEKVAYRAHLEKTQGPDAPERWENVEELKAYATVVAEENPDGLPTADSDTEDVDDTAPLAEATAESSDDDIEIIEEDSGTEEITMVTSSQAARGVVNALSTFLAVSMLATDTDTAEAKNDAQERKVTLTTVHAAKGLEWPAIFVPACENGTFPFYRSESPNEIDEERRLLYVAITRAQGFCTLSHSMTRMAGATLAKKDLTSFLSTVATAYKTLFVKKLQRVSKKTREEIAQVLGRPPPNEAAAEEMIRAHTEALGDNPPTYEYIPPTPGASQPQGGFSQGRFAGNSYQRYGNTGTLNKGASQGQWSNNRGPTPIPTGASQGFSSALHTYRTGPVKEPTPPPPVAAGSSTASSKLPIDQPRLSFGRAFSIPREPSPESAGPALSQEEEELPAPPLRPSQAGFKNPFAGGKGSRPPARKTGGPVSASAGPTSTSVSLPYQRPRMANPPSTARPLPQGLPNVPETRSSRISDVVLINPVAGEEVPSDLLVRWSSKEQQRLSEIKDLGAEMTESGKRPSEEGEAPAKKRR